MRTLYPAKQEPVPVPANVGWFAPLCEPTRLRALATAVIVAAGVFAAPFVPPPAATPVAEFTSPSQPMPRSGLPTATVAASGAFSAPYVAPVSSDSGSGARQYIVGGSPSPVFVNETGTRQYALSGVYINETFVAAVVEATSADKWLSPLSAPVLRTGLPTHQQQALAFVEAAPFAESVTIDRWQQPLSEPVRLPRALPANEQQYLAFVKASLFPETVSLDRWLQPLSGPVLAKPWTSRIEALTWNGFTPTPAEVVRPDKWFAPLSEPVRLRGLAPVEQQAVSGPTFVPGLSFDWHRALAEPTRRVPSVASHPAAFAPVFTPPLSFDWFRPLADPVVLKVNFGTAQQQALAAPAFVPPLSFGWFAPLEGPPKAKASVAASSRPYLAWSGFTPLPVEVITPDKWLSPLSEPVRLRQLAAAAQQGFAAPAFVPPVSFAWFRPLETPPNGRRLAPAAQPSFFWGNFTPAISFAWFAPLSEPAKPRVSVGAPAQRFLAWSGFTPATIEVVTPDKWFARLSEPVRVKPGLPASEQQALSAPVFTPALSFAWFQPLSLAPSVRTALHPARQGGLATPLRVGEIITSDKWYAPLAEPVRRASVGLDQVAGPPFVATAIEWLQPFAEPVRPRILPVAVEQHQAYVGLALFPSAVRVDSWFQPLAEPTPSQFRPVAGFWSIVGKVTVRQFPSVFLSGRVDGSASLTSSLSGGSTLQGTVATATLVGTVERTASVPGFVVAGITLQGQV